ncbi:hypothetical protein CBR_g78808 [Chara braunii]|uniref:DUF659 domain-containing protein n=1 Tax=Chara braunii TaxID=69332 RepID=A0A388KAH9_CHABU|nr:hypothetical protein CBR_g78808 [Chara braunii]|eukprot:GBG67029.1 hypothetical protein CBR_g78808 [Chara braunii]
MHRDRKLWCNLCKHIWQGNVSKATRLFTQQKKCRAATMDVLVDVWNDKKYVFAIEGVASLLQYMEDKGIREAQSVVGHSLPRVSSSVAPRDEVQDVLDEAEEREGGGLSDGVDLQGEEVVLTSRGAGAKDKGKRKAVDRDDRPPQTEKRVRQTRIDDVYDKEKHSHFNDKFLQWVYDAGIAFNAFRRPSWREVGKATEEMPRGVRMRFPSFGEIGGRGLPSQRVKLATLLQEVRESFAHRGATMLSDGRKSRHSRPIVNFLAADANGALLYATIFRDGSVPETGAIVYRGWRAIITSFPAKDVIAFCTDSASNYVAASKLLAQDPDPDTGGDPTGRDYLVVRTQIRHFHARRGDWGDRSLSDAEAQDCDGGDETARCAAWWLAHGAGHRELRAIAIRVMHMWTSASPAERNWAEHERIQTTKRNKLGFAKLAQLVEITINLKLALCRQHSGGYVLPWIMDREREEQRPPSASGEDEEDAEPEPKAWGQTDWDRQRCGAEEADRRMVSGGPPVGVPTGVSDRGVEGKHAPEREGGSDGQPVGDDDDQDVRDDSSDAGDDGEAANVGGFVNKVIVGLCAGDMEGGTPGGHGTLQGGDAVMEEESGLHTGVRAARVVQDTVLSWRVLSALTTRHGYVGRPSVHTAARILGLSDRQTRRRVFPAPGVVEDIRRGLPYTSGEEGDLYMPAGARRHPSISGLDAQIAADQRRFDELVRERDRLAETEAHGDDVDTKTEPIDVTVQRDRARRAATAAAAATTIGDPRIETPRGERATHGRGQSAPPVTKSGTPHHGTGRRRNGRS